MGLLLYAVIVVLFGAWLTIHVRLCAGLGRLQLWEGLVGLAIPPLALYWATKRRVPLWPTLWVVSISCYLVALLGGVVF